MVRIFTSLKNLLFCKTNISIFKIHMTASFIVIEGQHPGNLEEFLRVFNYSDTGEDKVFTDRQVFNEYLSEQYTKFAAEGIALRGIWTDEHFFLLSDPEMTDALNDEALAELSVRLGSRVLSFIIQTSSETFGFAVYNGANRRVFFASEGEILENTSDPLPEEQGLALHADIFAEDIYKLAHSFGIDIEGKQTGTYTVKQFALPQNHAITESRTVLQQTRSEKPWWKIW